MKESTTWVRAIVFFPIVLVSLGLWGCPNPNAIGVQQFGMVQVTCVQASNAQPVSGAIVTVDGVTASTTTDASGKVTVSQVPIGTHPVRADAPGLEGRDTVTVIENQTVQKKITMSPTQ